MLGCFLIFILEIMKKCMSTNARNLIHHSTITNKRCYMKVSINGRGKWKRLNS